MPTAPLALSAPAPPGRGADTARPPLHMNGIVTELPADWRPELAPVSILPEELCLQQVEFELFSGELDEPNTVRNPDVVLSRNLSGDGTLESYDFSGLLVVLANTFEKVRTFQKWANANGNAVQSMSPTEFVMLFSVLRTPEAQIAVAALLKETRQTITCSHIKCAASACLNVCQKDVLDLLCSIPISDKENISIVQNSIGMLNFVSLEHHFVQ